METARMPECPDAAASAHNFPDRDRQLRCPACGSSNMAKASSDRTLDCRQCSTCFPLFRCNDETIPWLFADPDNARMQWKARYNGFLHANSMELERLRQARRDKGNSEVTRRRVNHKLQAREQYRSQVEDILAPLQLEQIDWPADATSLLQSSMPRNQGLANYTANIFRDWAWDNGENQALLDVITSVLDADPRQGIGSVLTLGAGACRLSYDLHRHCSTERSTVLDINPLLLQIACRVIQGEKLPLYEFPIAPLDKASFAVLQHCSAPEALRGENFCYVLGDAMNPPFAAKSFDTVLTPWLIDIVAHDVKALLPRINHCLADGGMWLNTGTLAFFHQNESWCYSEEEVRELVEESGFEILSWERKTVPYLQSPHSAHGRTESVLSFLARKTEHADAVDTVRYLPEWILDTSRPVPSSTEAAIQSANHLLKSQVLASIDGKRNIRQIGKTLARQYGLGVPETSHAVRQVLIDAWEQASQMKIESDF